MVRWAGAGGYWRGAPAHLVEEFGANAQGADRVRVRIGQVYEDQYLSSRKRRWLFQVMRVNARSVRVEPVEDDGWFTLVGFEWQYRIDNLRQFEGGRYVLVRDTGDDA